MLQLKNIKIKVRLPLFVVLATLLPLIVLSIFIMQINSTALRTNFNQILDNQAESSVRYVTDAYENQISGLIYSAKLKMYPDYLEALASGSVAETTIQDMEDHIEEQQAVSVATSNRLTNIFLLNKEGNVVACPDSLSIGKSFVKRESFINVMAGEEPAMDIILENGQREALIGYPVKNSAEETIGVIVRQVTLSELDNYVMDLKIGENGYVFILDNHGELLSYSNQNLPNEFITSKALQDFSEKIKKNELTEGKGSLSYSVESGSVVAEYNVSNNTGWTVVAAIPESEIIQSSNKANNTVRLTILVAGMISLIMGLLFVRSLIKPMNDLVGKIDDVADGKLDHLDAYKGKDEIAQIYDAVNTMAHNLEVSYKKLNYAATTDILTGITNRNGIYEIMDREFENSGQAVMLLDLDGFKSVNDSYGHDYGDDVLISVAEILKSVENDVTHVSRLGGDEFLIYVTAYRGRRDVLKVGQKICDDINNIKSAIGKAINISASIGISFSDDKDQNSRSLIKKADIAMYEIKKGGKNGVGIFDNRRELF